MKKLSLLLLVFPLFTYAQIDCDSHAAVGVSYIFPKGVSVEGAYFISNRITAGIGVAYTLPTRTAVKNSTEENESVNNTLHIFAYAGYKVLQVDYVISAFLNAGYTMGDVNSLRPFVSSKIVFPSGQKAFAIEPFYIFGGGISGRATLYIKL